MNINYVHVDICNYVHVDDVINVNIRICIILYYYTKLINLIDNNYAQASLLINCY